MFNPIVTGFVFDRKLDGSSILLKNVCYENIHVELEEKDVDVGVEVLYVDYGKDLVNPVTPDMDPINLAVGKLKTRLEIEEKQNFEFNIITCGVEADVSAEQEMSDAYVEKCDKESGLYYYDGYCECCLDIVNV